MTVWARQDDKNIAFSSSQELFEFSSIFNASTRIMGVLKTVRKRYLLAIAIHILANASVTIGAGALPSQIWQLGEREAAAAKGFA